VKSAEEDDLESDLDLLRKCSKKGDRVRRPEEEVAEHVDVIIESETGDGLF
jgi:hypothetical protein